MDSASIHPSAGISGDGQPPAEGQREQEGRGNADEEGDPGQKEFAVAGEVGEVHGSASEQVDIDTLRALGALHHAADLGQ